MSEDNTQNGDAGQPSYSAPAVDKAFEIIDLVAGEIAGLTVTDMAVRLGRSTSQIYRVVVSLHRLGLLHRDEESDRYALTLKLFEIASRHPPLQRLIGHATPILERLAEETDQSCHLAAISGASLVILAQADSPMAMHYTIRLGSRFPVMETSSGVAIAAHQSAARQQSLLDGFSASEQAAFRSRFAELVANGFERRESEVTAGVVNLSTPILDAQGRSLGAITCLFLPQRRMRATLDTVLEKVVEAGQQLNTIMQNA
ncbi:IclR family transcriptional regulator [Devosia sp. A449]